MAISLENPGTKRRASLSPSSPPSLKKSRASPQKVKFFIMSDTHDLDLSTDSSSAFRRPAQPVDVVLHCGDLTDIGCPNSIERAMRMLGSVNAELRLFIAGNHELALDKEYWISQGGSEQDHDKAVSLVNGNLAKECGVTYLNEGTHTFTLKSGATFTIYASPYTPQYGQSAFQYSTNEDRYNPVEQTPRWAVNTSTESSRIPDNVDIVMTHGPAKYILDDTERGSSGGCEHLRRALCRSKPKLHCFGHIHHSYGAQKVIYPTVLADSEAEEDGVILLSKEFAGRNQARKKGYSSLSPGSADLFLQGEECLAVNAAIENPDGPNAPWLIEMEF